jgi:putative sugar O-methyltransferase
MLIQNLFKSLARKPPPAPEAAMAQTTNGDTQMRVGDALQRAGKLDEAEAAYRRALEAGAPGRDVNPRLQAVVAQIARNYEQPGSLIVAPGDGRALPWSVAECRAMREAVEKELTTVPAVMPSKFWVTHAQKHIDILDKFGLQHFKRTVAHNYYNWLTISLQDAQISRLVELWHLHGSSEALGDEMEDVTKSNVVSVSAFNDIAAQRFYRLGVSLLWDYTLQTDHHGLLRKIAEPVTGNPIKVMRRGRLLSQDLAHSVRERNRIVDHAQLDADAAEPVVIAELGAGHGRLAHVFALTTRCKYVIFDITPALLVSQWYITSLFPGEKIFTFRHFDTFDEIAQEMSECRFAFFASSQLEKFPEKYFDVFINVCSLMEMRKDTIAYFFRHIERVTRGHFYTKQWLIQNNQEDDIVIERDDYPVPSTWVRRFEGIDPINQRLFEEVWEIR